MKSKIKQFLHYAHIALATMLLAATYNEAVAQKSAPPLNPKLQGLATGNSNARWIEFRDGFSINPLTFFIDLKEGFELSSDDEMLLKKTQLDKLSFKHFRYQQYYKNRQVMYAEFIVHQNAEGLVKSANGLIISGIKSTGTASLNESSALGYALNFMNAKKYLWQNEEMQKQLRNQEKNLAATYYPKGELVFVPNNFDGNFTGADYSLAWQFKIYTDDKDVIAKTVYVDAASGKIIHYTDLSMICSSGSGASAFNGNVNVSTQVNSGSFRSHNDCQATDIIVYNCNGGAAVNTYYTDADNAWNNQSAIQAMWGAERTYSYFNTTHSRQSWDGSAGDMIAYNNAFSGQNNACWGCTGNSTIYYAGNTAAATDDWNTNDIMGHEFAHGVTQAAAGLIYNKESGALNESFSDIFGEMVESFSEGNCDWLVGADRGAIRSFINPNAYGDPDTYLGTNYKTTSPCTPSGSNDQCGVHSNSSVQNRMFYLLANGGSGTTDFNVPYNVTAIGRFKARDIAYRALDLYLTGSNGFIDARAAWLRAAFDLYGGCSTEIIAVGDAWHAVGVESTSAQFSKNTCGAIASGTFVQAISHLQGGNGCSNTISAGANITYYAARDKVTLYPGFRAAAGSRFIAYLEPCSSTMWKSGGNNGEIMSDAEKGISLPVVDNKIPATEILTHGDNVSVYPNPFRSAFDVAVSSKQASKATVSLFNSLGIKIVERPAVDINKGTNKISFDGSKLQKGVYMVEIFLNGEKTVRKIVKM